MVRYRPPPVQVHRRRAISAYVPPKETKYWFRRALYISCQLRFRKPTPSVVMAKRKVFGVTSHLLQPYQIIPKKYLPHLTLAEAVEGSHMPKDLFQPDIPDIDPARIAIADPGYAGIPPAQVRNGWSLTLHSFPGFFEHLYVDPPHSTLSGGRNILLTLNGQIDPPSHIFCVYPTHQICSPIGPSRRILLSGLDREVSLRQVLLYPVHSAIWAAHCSRLPPLPPAKSKLTKAFQLTHEIPAWCTRLPMFPLPLPHPAQFHILANYVYTRDRAQLIKSILRIDLPGGSAPDSPGDVICQQLTEMLAVFKDENIHVIWQIGLTAHQVYQNGCALGMVDPNFWKGVNLSWNIAMACLFLIYLRQQWGPGVRAGICR